MLLHDTWGRRSTNKRREKEKSRVPLHDTHQAVHFFKYFFNFRGGRRNRRKQHEEDIKELCPNTTHGEEVQTQDETTNSKKNYNNKLLRI